MRKILPLLIFSLLPVTVSAQTTSTIPPSHPSIMRGTRPLGMGNAGIAMPGTDENAMFYNPAAINDYERRLRFRLVSPMIDLTTASIGLIQDVRDLVDNINNNEGDTSAQINTFNTFVTNHTGEFHSLDVRLPVIMAMHQWFAVGIVADSRTTVSFRNRAFSNFELNSRSDGGGVIGSAYNFKDLLGIQQNVQAGVDVKVLYRLSIDQVLTTDDIIATTDFKDAIPLNRGLGVGVDLGLKGEIPTFDLKALDFLKPTVGFVWQDIGNTKFQGDVEDTEQSIGLGAAFHPTFQLAKRDWQTHLDIDLREINQPVSFPKKLSLGGELVAPKFGFFRPSIRVGADQLYITAGATFDFRFLKLEFATYGEELGRFTRQKQSRRIAGNISFGF